MNQPPLTAEQEAAAETIESFLSARRVARNWVTLEGLAGVGKTYLLAELAKRHPGALLVAPTGKAASVLSRKTGLPVNTIHGAIYLFRGEYESDDGERYLSFKPKIGDDAWRRKIVFLDEKSMCDERLGTDLMATGCRVVAAGDPGQLPPVRGVPFFDASDITLREIHRQALESPIIRQAHAVRAGGIYAADGPDFRVQRSVGRDDILAADVILCWRNATRHALNALARAHRGLDGPAVKGERVVCLRNDHRMGVLNGALYELLADHDTLRRTLRLVNERGETVTIEDVRFEGDETDHGTDARDEHPFGYGFVLTTHKSQGSEFDNVIFVDEYDRYEHRKEFVYTGITRAAKRMLVYNTWS